jgi:hypothetical protein
MDCVDEILGAKKTSWAWEWYHLMLVEGECLRVIVEDYLVLTLTLSEKMISCLCERDRVISDVRLTV